MIQISYNVPALFLVWKTTQLVAQVKFQQKCISLGLVLTDVVVLWLSRQHQLFAFSPVFSKMWVGLFFFTYNAIGRCFLTVGAFEKILIHLRHREPKTF